MSAKRSRVRVHRRHVPLGTRRHVPAVSPNQLTLRAAWPNVITRLRFYNINVCSDVCATAVGRSPVRPRPGVRCCGHGTFRADRDTSSHALVVVVVFDPILVCGYLETVSHGIRLDLLRRETLWDVVTLCSDRKNENQNTKIRWFLSHVVCLF